MRALPLIFILTIAAFAGAKHDFDRPVFIYAHHPDLPISDFARGKLGIPAPEQARIYLYAAYRYLNNAPFTKQERDAYLYVWEQRAHPNDGEPPVAVTDDPWTSIRKTISVPLPPPNPTPQFARPIRNFVYENICSDDAFDRSAEILHSRIAKFGIDSPAVKFWTQGQDRVFAACNGSATQLPDPAPANLPPLIKADRDYQIAAALFYSQRFDEALPRFRAIAKDRNSPWHIWAPYLIGRTLLWQARLTQSEPDYFKNLKLAETQFRSVLADHTLAVTHLAAERLLDRCLLATDTVPALERIASRLVSPRAAASRDSDLFMYLNAVDAIEEPVYNDAGKLVHRHLALPQDDFSLWWETFQSGDPAAYNRAFAQWQRTSSNAWLYCALSKAGETSTASSELLAAVVQFPWNHPAGPAVHYHVARLLSVKARINDARAEIGKTVEALDHLPSARNRALDLQAQLAPTVEDFAKLLPRPVIMASTEMDADEWNSQTKIREYWRNWRPEQQALARVAATKAARSATALAAQPRLDYAGARVLSEKLPLDAMRAIALDPHLLPPNLATELKLVVWTRAILLNRFDVARELAPIIAAEHPAVAAQLRNLTEAAAARVLLDLPGARPYMTIGYGRIAPAEQHDEWGRNWWYRFTPAEMYGMDLPYVGDVGSFGRLHPTQPFLLARLPFLTDAQQQQAAIEWQQLAANGTRGFNWIATRIAKDIQSHFSRSAADARTLYLVIHAAEVNQWANQPDFQLPQTGLKSVYRLLATRYPTSDYLRRAKNIRGLYLDQIK